MTVAEAEARREAAEHERWLRENTGLGEYWDLLDELKATYAISPERVKSLLFPNKGRLFSDLPLHLPGIEARRRLYRRAMARLLADEPGLDDPGNASVFSRSLQVEYRHLRTLLAAIEQQRRREIEGAKRIRLNPRRPFGLRPEDLGTRQPRDIPPKAGRRWPWIGDRAVALARYLATKIPAERARGRRVPGAGRPYTSKVLRLTARLLHFAYPWIPQLKAPDVASRIQKASKRERTSQVISPQPTRAGQDKD
jgi:hypothetical protein